MRKLPVLLLLLIAVGMGIISSSCREEEKPVFAGDIDPEKFPTMKTLDVSTLISDSGITRYKVTSPVWLVFDEAKTPQWQFPKGIHLEKYDDFFRRDATVDADRATYYKDKQLWKLDGYVRIANIANEKFLTPQLFWDQRQQKLYSDSFIHIEKSDRTIEGYGFESNEQMTDYRVRNVSGIFPASQFKGGSAPNDSTSPTRVVKVSSPAQNTAPAAPASAATAPVKSTPMSVSALPVDKRPKPAKRIVKK